MSDFNAFKSEWYGRRIIDPLLIGHGETAETAYQCVTLIKQYLTECYSLIINYPGNAIDIWYNPPAILLEAFYRIESSEAQAGDIVVLHTLGHNDATQPGHVGIATGSIDDSSVDILEQNGATGGGTGQGGDAIRTRYVPRARVAGCWRPRVLATSTPPPLPYYIVLPPDFTPKQVVTKQDAVKWDCSYPDLASMEGHTQGTSPAGVIFQANALLHHNDTNKDYYLSDANDPVGFLVDDCSDYSPPPPAPPPVYLPPSAPLRADSPRYKEIVKDIPGYSNATAAAEDIQKFRSGIVTAGSDYFLFRQSGGMDNVTLESGISGQWINPKDNRPEPEPVKPVPLSTDWYVAPEPVVEPEAEVVAKPELPTHDSEAKVRMSIMWFMPDHTAIDCEIIKPVMMSEVFSKHDPIQLKKGKMVRSYGTFSKDGRIYALFRLANDPNFDKLLGIPVKSHADLSPYLEELYSYADHARFKIQEIKQVIDGFISPKRRKR